MKRFFSDGSYKKDLRVYSEGVLEKYGISTPTAEREIMYMSDSGNTVTSKLYADLIFNRKILRRYPYREAFELYKRSAGISISESGEWQCSGVSYPLAFWEIGYYLVNYRNSSFLKKCEDIPEIDAMSHTERLETAFELSTACIRNVDSAAAVNLIARILSEASETEELFKRLQPVFKEELGEPLFQELYPGAYDCETMEGCAATAESFFEAAAREGYVYACNNLAAREAERAVAIGGESPDSPELKEVVEAYVRHLKSSADRYEPYAANRLGLFYVTGEISGTSGKIVCKNYVNRSAAREYFLKATVYPDTNSAWAFFNLIKYFQKDFDDDIEKMNEYMDYIKELNQQVYDLAMEL